MMRCQSLAPSELGTKEYWDAIYRRELQNNAQDEEDEGTVWFSESNAEVAVLGQLEKLAEAGLLAQYPKPEGTKALLPLRFLDLGTGNGHMLFELCETFGGGNFAEVAMLGVDYSAESVQLARRIAAQRLERGDDSSQRIRFECWDLLRSPPGDWLEDAFDVVLDKGTFDAISLMEHHDGSQPPCNIYREKVIPLIKPGRFLSVTSCNWTKDELVELLAPHGGELAHFNEATYPTFTFGGQTGQSIVTIIFQRQHV